MSELVLYQENPITTIIGLVTNAVASQNSKRAYKRALVEFFDWYDEQGRPPLVKDVVNRYKAHLLDNRGMSAASVNLALSAIRKFVMEAVDNGLPMPPGAAEGIGRVKGVKRQGVRTGNWLPKSEAQQLLDAPDANTLKGKRDRAMLAIMLGGGLRRSEVANLTYEHIQMRDARWVIVDLVGKHNRVRTVPIPSWAKLAVDEWTTAAGLTTGPVFRAVNKGGKVAGSGMTPQAVYNAVVTYAEGLGAHDLRRTFAKLAHKGGAPLEQIQLTLGHASIKTTEIYLGVQQDLTHAPCDVLGLSIG
jgi:integrase